MLYYFYFIFDVYRYSSFEGQFIVSNRSRFLDFVIHIIDSNGFVNILLRLLIFDY